MGGAGGLTRYEFPTLNISPLDGVFLEPFISGLPSLLSPLCPSRPTMHHYSARSLGTAPLLTAVRAAGVLGQETGEGISAGGRGRLYVETVLRKE